MTAPAYAFDIDRWWAHQALLEDLRAATEALKDPDHQPMAELEAIGRLEDDETPFYDRERHELLTELHWLREKRFERLRRTDAFDRIDDELAARAERRSRKLRNRRGATHRGHRAGVHPDQRWRVRQPTMEEMILSDAY